MRNLLIKNCNIVDLRMKKILEDSQILIHRGIICKILKDDIKKLVMEPNTATYDARGLYALPGLIDCHVHLCHEGNPSLARSFYPQEKLEYALFRAAKNLFTAIVSGVTTIRDVGTYQRRNIIIRDIIDSGFFPFSPRIFACGNALTYPGAHGCEFGREVKGVDNVKKAVRDEIKSGADCIKVINDPINFTEEELNAIVLEAHRFGKKVACHAYTKEAVKMAINAKVDTIEHGVPFTKKMALDIRKENIIIVPTLYCAIKTCEDISKSLISECELPIFEKWLNDLIKKLPLAFRYNVKVATGTDSGFPPLEFNSIVGEILNLYNVHKNPVDILRCATITSAEALGLEGVLGDIKPGKLADILLLEDNPIKNIDAIQTINTIIKGGKIITSDKKSQFLII